MDNENKMYTLEDLINNTTFTLEEIENIIKIQAWIDSIKKIL